MIRCRFERRGRGRDTTSMRSTHHRSAWLVAGLVLGMAWPLGLGSAYAQLLRIGPLDISPSAGIEGVYSSNVEGVRDSETDKEQEDYFLLMDLGLTLDAELAVDWTAQSELSVEAERHLNRTDLDTDNFGDLFGELNFQNEVTRGRYNFLLAASYRRAREVDDDTFISGRFKTRDPVKLLDTETALEWVGQQLTLRLGYLFGRERHDEVEFQEGDKDTHTFTASADYEVNSRISVFYDFERTKTDLINVEETDAGEEDWLDTHRVGVSYAIFEQGPPFPPGLTYSLVAEREEQAGQTAQWEPIHVITMDEDLELNTVRLRANASYTVERDREQDDVAFVYSVELEHDVNRTLLQSLTLTREPRDTFGSTTDTDSTEYAYHLSKQALFVENMELDFLATYSEDDPSGPDAGATEKTWRYEVGVFHTRDITRRISRRIGYEYYYEDVNTINEPLDEHRVTLRYDYQY